MTAILKRLSNQLDQLSLLHKQQGTAFLTSISSNEIFQQMMKDLNILTIEDFQMNYSRKEFFAETTIRYMKIVEREDAGIGLFFFPKGMGFPTHDHVDMLVGTKILDGALSTQPYTAIDREEHLKLHEILCRGKHSKLTEEDNATLNQGLRVKKGEEFVLNNGEAAFLTPNMNNIHRVKALDQCVMLDVFIPNSPLRNFYEVIEGESDRLKLNTQGTTLNLEQLDYDKMRQF